MTDPRWTEQTARALTEGWMAHLGYTPDRIVQTHAPRPHNRTDPDIAYHCDLTSEGWQCWDENGEPAHPIHDAADEIAEQVVFMLDALADAGLLLPPGGTTREEWGHRYERLDGESSRVIAAKSLNDAKRDVAEFDRVMRRPAQLVRRMRSVWPIEGEPNDNWPLYTGPWEPVPDITTEGATP